MSEINVLGYNRNSSNSKDTGIDSQQYAIFRLKPEIIGFNRYEIYWLKDVTNRFGFSIIFEGTPSAAGADETWLAVRPRFLIG